MRTEIRQCLDDLAPAARELASASTHLYPHQRWLRVEEAAHPGARLYAWTDGPHGAALAAAYRFDETSNPWPAARLDLFAAAYAPGIVTDPAALLPSVLLGGRRPGHSHILTAGDPGRRRELLTEIVAATAQCAADRGAATLAALYCDRDDGDLAAAFAAHGGVEMPAPGLNELVLPGASFDDWLAALPAKRRSAERTDQRRNEAAGIRCEVRPLRAADIDEIVPLELSLYDRYGHNYRTAEAEALHRAYLDRLGDDALLVRAVRDGRTAGFASVVRHGRRAYVRQGGFDRDVCAGAPVYFQAAFHEPIRWAYASGVRTIDLSISADEAKHHRGARLRPRSAWVVPLNAGAAAACR
jgi:hypothetical protein